MAKIEMEKLMESLSVNEVKILPWLNEQKVGRISEKSNLEEVSVLRALEYLEKKKIVNLNKKERKIIEIGVNGSLYKSKGLPERRLLKVMENSKIVSLHDARKISNLNDEEFRASIGVLKKKDLIDLKNNNLVLKQNKIEISKKMPEEIILESLPLSFDSLPEELRKTLKNLENRKDLIDIKEEKITEISVTELGKKLMGLKIKSNFIEQITPKILGKDSLWKGKKFRRYDVTSSLPKIHGGKRHFVLQSSDYARKIWTEMGFREMTGNMIQSSFWNFDALFTAQDHPVRDMQDTFFLNEKLKEINANKKIIQAVKKSHEGSLKEIKSRGWNYKWNEEEAKKLVLRTHTTCLSAQTLSTLKKENLPAKFFALGKCFRNETVDWSHGFEFNQTEGIVIDENANFRHLLGYLKLFFKKMGFEKVRFRPAYFPYTEPSVEIDVYHKEKEKWLELGGAGIFRPEVVIPLLGENIPVLAWGPGFDRILMDYYEIKDLRELYKNDIAQLRKIKSWVKT